eukprot:TRINITY_DN59453_c0_g2_i1.p1 TRINITY_DN59453_c0_g2~~TRINITY_DN59453_c0_g2_i1.p1  ORF type:complete len:423 (-),score=43.53 TRINITY_DN59453_c0_g2_i1:107-1375(-)
MAEKWHGLQEFDLNGDAAKSAQSAWQSSPTTGSSPTSSVSSSLWTNTANFMADKWTNGRVSKTTSRRHTILKYIGFTKMGSQVMHSGLDQKLVELGRNYVSSVDDEEAGLHPRVKHMYAAWQGWQRNGTTDRKSSSSGASCLHFEAQHKDFFVWDKPQRESKDIDHDLQKTNGESTKLKPIPGCPKGQDDLPEDSYVDIPLQKKIFLFSGQSTMWPSRHVATITGTAFLNVTEDGKLMVYFTMFTQSEIPDFLAPAPSAPKPAFYVGSVDGKKGEKAWPTPQADNREPPICMMQWQTKYHPFAVRSLEKLQTQNPIADYDSGPSDTSPICKHRIAAFKAWGVLPEYFDIILKASYQGKYFAKEIGVDRLLRIVRGMEGAAACSGPYLWRNSTKHRDELLVPLHAGGPVVEERRLQEGPPDGV